MALPQIPKKRKDQKNMPEEVIFKMHLVEHARDLISSIMKVIEFEAYIETL